MNWSLFYCCTLLWVLLDKSVAKKTKMWNVNVCCKSSCQSVRAAASRVNEGVLVPRCVGWLAGRDNKPYCLTCSVCPSARFTDIQTALFTPLTPQLRLKVQSKCSAPQIRDLLHFKTFITWGLSTSGSKRVTFLSTIHSAQVGVTFYDSGFTIVHGSFVIL